MKSETSASGPPASEGHPLARRLEILALIGIAALAILLRSVNLLSLPIFNDEAVYLRWAADILDQRTLMSLFIPVAEDGKQPVFIWLATASMMVFSDPLLAGRVVSVVAGTASLVGVWLAGRWLLGRRLALVAALLYAITPYTVLFDRMALADSLVSMTAIWSLALGTRVATNVGSRRRAVLEGVALGGTMALGVWVKPTALFALPIPILCATLLSSSLRPSRLSVFSLTIAYGVFAAGASLLFVMPYAENQLVLLATHVYSPAELNSSLPTLTWEASCLAYLQWVQAYLPAPMWWLSMAGAAWGIAKRRRLTLLLIGCWLGIVVPSVAMAHYFSSRYVLNSVFPLLFLAVPFIEALWVWLSRFLKVLAPRWNQSLASGSLIVLGLAAVGLPSFLYDASLISDPLHAAWPERDRDEYVDGWPAGAGFNEALALTLSKAREYGQQEVFVMSDQIQGFPHDGIALYIRHMPRIRHYVEAEIAWGGRGIIEKWRSHNAKMLIIRDDGRHKPEMFESRVPEAKLIGTFWKPGGKSSFRVYELDLQSAGSSGR